MTLPLDYLLGGREGKKRATEELFAIQLVEATRDRARPSNGDIYCILELASELGYPCGIDLNGFAHVDLPNDDHLAFRVEPWAGSLHRPHPQLQRETAEEYYCLVSDWRSAILKEGN